MQEINILDECNYRDAIIFIDSLLIKDLVFILNHKQMLPGQGSWPNLPTNYTRCLFVLVTKLIDKYRCTYPSVRNFITMIDIDIGESLLGNLLLHGKTTTYDFVHHMFYVIDTYQIFKTTLAHISTIPDNYLHPFINYKHNLSFVAFAVAIKSPYFRELSPEEKLLSCVSPDFIYTEIYSSKRSGIGGSDELLQENIKRIDSNVDLKILLCLYNKYMSGRKMNIDEFYNICHFLKGAGITRTAINHICIHAQFMVNTTSKTEHRIGKIGIYDESDLREYYNNYVDKSSVTFDVYSDNLFNKFGLEYSDNVKEIKHEGCVIC